MWIEEWMQWLSSAWVGLIMDHSLHSHTEGSQITRQTAQNIANKYSVSDRSSSCKWVNLECMPVALTHLTLKNFSAMPLMLWIFAASFTEIHPLSREISCQVKQVLQLTRRTGNRRTTRKHNTFATHWRQRQIAECRLHIKPFNAYWFYTKYVISGISIGIGSFLVSAVSVSVELVVSF